MRRLATLTVSTLLLTAIAPAVTPVSAGPGKSPASASASFTTTGSLTAVAARSAHNVWAVGEAGSPISPQTLIVHWDGVSWNRVPSPSPGTGSVLAGVVITSAHRAWAVGETDTATGSRTLILRWDGVSWKQVGSPSPGNSSLNGVAAVSPRNVWAVGSTDDRPLILHWNGSVWRRVPSPHPAGGLLSGVAMATAHGGWAVGSVFSQATNSPRNLVLHWNGKVWKRVFSPSPGGSGFLADVVATSTHNAWAVGCARACAVAGFNRPLIERWNGTAWKRVAVRGLPPGILGGVAATTVRNAWAVGLSYVPNGQSVAQSARTLILHWNGTTWKRVSSPKSGVTSSLGGVSATSTRHAWAVGQYGSKQATTLISQWNGTAWSEP